MDTSKIIILVALFIQSLTLGHGAVYIAMHSDKPKWWLLPTALTVCYYLFVFTIHPEPFRYRTTVNNFAVYDAIRYTILVIAISSIVEGLLHLLQRKEDQLQEALNATRTGQKDNITAP